MADTNPPYYEWENFKLKATTPDEFVSALKSLHIETDAKFEAVDLTVNYPTIRGAKTTTQKGFKVTTSGTITPPDWAAVKLPHIKDFVGLKLYEVSNSTSTYKLLQKREEVTKSASYTTDTTYRIDESGNGSATQTINISGLVPSNYTITHVGLTYTHGSYFATYSSSCSWSGTTLTIHFYGERGSTATTSVTETTSYSIHVTSKPPQFFEADKTYLLAGAELVTTHNGYFTVGLNDEDQIDFTINSSIVQYVDKLDNTNKIINNTPIDDNYLNYAAPLYGVKNHRIGGWGNPKTAETQGENNSGHFLFKNTPTGMSIQNPYRWGYATDNGTITTYSEFPYLGQLNTNSLKLTFNKSTRKILIDDKLVGYLPLNKKLYVCRCYGKLETTSNTVLTALGVSSMSGSGDGQYKYAIRNYVTGPLLFHASSRMFTLGMVNSEERNFARELYILDDSYTTWSVPVSSTFTAILPRYSSSAWPSGLTISSKNFWQDESTQKVTVTYPGTEPSAYPAKMTDYYKLVWGYSRGFSVATPILSSGNWLKSVNLTLVANNLKGTVGVSSKWKPECTFNPIDIQLNTDAKSSDPGTWTYAYYVIKHQGVWNSALQPTDDAVLKLVRDFSAPATSQYYDNFDIDIAIKRNQPPYIYALIISD